MSRSRNRVTLWLDTETTGTDPERHGIVQLAGSIGTAFLQFQGTALSRR